MLKDLKEKMSSRKTLADTFSLITWSFIVETPRELFIGMTIAQTFYSRLAGIPVDLVIGRPYGIYLDWIRGKFNAEEPRGIFTKSRLKRIFADTFALTSFMMPVYTIILHYLIGINWETTFLAVISAIPYSLWQGAPYGIYNSWIRKLIKAI